MPRLVLGVGIPAVMLVVGLGSFLAYRSELPDRVATSYDGPGGTPDYSMTLGQLLLVSIITMTLGIMPCVAIALTRRKLHQCLILTMSFCGAVLGAVGAMLPVVTVINQRGLEHWQDARLPSSLLIAMIGSAVIVGGLAMWAAYSITPADRQTVSQV